MNPEIEKLIEYALADGVITDKEIGIILRKAEKLGEDIDEVEMIISAKKHLLQKQTSVTAGQYQTNKTTSKKEGEVYKCPSCGDVVNSFSINCISCGHEFRGSVNRSKVNELVSELKKIEELEWKSNPYSGSNGGPRLDHMVTLGIASKQCPLIENFPVPNTKEDILEFLALAMPIGLKKFSWSEKYTFASEYQLQKSYKAKAQQIIIKARIAFNSDKRLLEQIEAYAKQLGIN